MNKKKMTFEEAAQYIAEHALDIDPEEDDINEAEEARQLALQALKTASGSLINISMESGLMHIIFSREIGMIMNGEDVSSDINGQRYYGIHALTDATAAMAKAMVNDGCEIELAMRYVMDSLKTSLEENLGIIMSVGEMDEASAAELLREKASDGKDA